MASLDSLPADQRAVLQLVLQRGRSYDEIARLLSIDRAAVRQRALTAFDALGPQTGVSDQRRALITDYLLGQLPPKVAEQTRDRLAQSPSERAWARVLASELAPLASEALPEIPVEVSSPRTPQGAEEAAGGPPVTEPVAAAAAADAPTTQPGADKPGRQSILLRRRRQRSGREPKPPKTPKVKAPPEPAGPVSVVPEQDPSSPRRSRVGGRILIGAVVVLVAVAAVILLSSGGSSPKKATPPTAAASSTTTAGSSTTGTASTASKILAQINLTPPSKRSKAAGIAEILKEGATDGIAIVAQHVPANTTKPPNAYAVWLYNSANDAHILGFVNPGVSSSGKLSTAGGLPANAAHYKQLIVTVETKASPKTPGTIILQGPLTGL
jgi:hypothetical protein